MASIDQFKTTYFEECSELLDALYGYLGLSPMAGPMARRCMRSFARCIRSRAVAVRSGFSGCVKFAHVLETLLDLLAGDGANADCRYGQLCCSKQPTR